MRLVLSRRRPAVLALQPCAVWSGVISLLRTGKEDNYLNALMLPVICSGSAEAARLANRATGITVLSVVVRPSTPRERWGPEPLGRLEGSPLQTCRPNNRVLVSTTDVCTPLSSPLIRWSEVSKQSSGAYPRSRTAITTARILFRKLQRYMYLSAHGVPLESVQSTPSVLALPLVEFWY
ncbi:hypothetical protein L207DRAFT_299351 [Hyaloscypha variabilis F]|jgi:hypothetical protein|uniref:Uncharacterized protein n=1 Tax=Hyaloscypha variabilis (strain UAMH 11265 / GT02V1 / F) TaxID=1149755 RepID=A0A2J6RYC1_HYAVF|nr:hypothetical protein L207DRAFT_299351 [Hyaloscypha variabilis F]